MNVRDFEDDEDDGFMAGLARLDRFLSGEEQGEVPLEVLRERGIDIPDDDAPLGDAELRAKLWDVLEGMAEIGMVVECTNHLSDRELYRFLVTEALLEPTFLSDGGVEHLSPIGGCSEEDNAIYLRFYADDEDRAAWADPGASLPPKEKPPYDRDRFLPGGAEWEEGRRR